MSDTGAGYYIAIGIGILVATILAFYVLKFIGFSIKFLLTDKKK